MTDTLHGRRIEACGYLSVELRIHPPEDGLSIPQFTVLVNLDVVLFEVDCHFLVGAPDSSPALSVTMIPARQ
jgi:hypothetical protein